MVKTDARSRLRKLSLESLETGDGVEFLSKLYSPRKLTWNPENGGLEDEFPFQNR